MNDEREQDSERVDVASQEEQEGQRMEQDEVTL